MKFHTVHLTFNLPARMAFENITPKVEQIVTDCGVREGRCLVNAMHTHPDLRRLPFISVPNLPPLTRLGAPA